MIKVGTVHELERCVQKKILQLSTNSGNKVLGEKLFVKQQLELAPFKAVPFSNEGDWEQNPLNNRSWQWRLNWLSFLSYLMAYHQVTRDQAVLNLARKTIVSWLETYLETDTSYPFEFIWHDHATALRAEQLVLFDYYCREYAPEWAKKHHEFLTYLERALVVHGEWLAKDSFYSEHTNHGLEQARVLLLLGTVFEGEEALKWQQVAIQRISNELTFAFTDEGVHVENSPAYHIFVFKVFMGIIKDYPAEVLGDLDEQFSRFSGKALSFITHILRPDGKLPPIGDTEQLPTSDGYREMFGHTLEYQYFLYALTQGKQGLVPPVLNRVYSQSGYAVFRDHWPVKEHYSDAFHLIAKVGCSSRYHHQQDEGHISLYAGGEDWLIDSGLFNYINKDPVRKYMRGRPGHNVPIISHTTYDKEFEHRLGAWQVTAFSELAPAPQLTMKLEVLRPVVQERRVVFDALAKGVEVNDTISADDGELRNITLQWHLPSDKTLSIEGNTVIVTSRTGNRLMIDFEGETPDNLSVATGHKDARVFSCISYKANQVEPSQVLRVMFKERRVLNVTTRFRFDMVKSRIVPHSQKANVSELPLDILLKADRQTDPVAHSVMLGNAQAYLALSKAHREQGFGHVSLLVNDASACQHVQSELSQHYLTTWLKCLPIALAKVPPASVENAALQGLEGVGRLIITSAGFTEKHLTAVLLSMLSPLLKRMNKCGEVWISACLPDNLKSLCISFAEQHEVSPIVVTDLGDTLRNAL